MGNLASVNSLKTCHLPILDVCICQLQIFFCTENKLMIRYPCVNDTFLETLEGKLATI